MKWKYPYTEYVLRRISIPIAKYIAPYNIDPNIITVIGFIIGIFSAIMISQSYLIAGLILIILSQIVDVVDGDLARITKTTSKAGMFLDSLLDRIVDTAMILGLTMIDYPKLGILGIGAISGSIIVSYVRKQAEAAGVECKVGFATRDIRNLVIILAITFQIFYSNSIYYFFIILVIITYFTIIQRAVYTFKKIDLK